MLQERTVYLNGDHIPWDGAKVHLMSHSLGRGSAIFEVLSLHATPKGPAVFRLDEHVDRFFQTADLLQIDLPVSKTELHAAVLETINRNGIGRGFIKVIGFYSAIAFDILPPPGGMDLAVFVVDPTEDLGGLHFPLQQGASLCISKYRKLDPQTVPVKAKAAANYLNGMLSSLEARERGFDMALMLDTQGFVAECATESIFLVKNDLIMTPCLGTVLESITRKSILETGKAAGFETLEGRLTAGDLNGADEIFLSGTPDKLLPVRRIEERNIDGTPGAVTRKLTALMERILAGEEEKFQGWLFPSR